MDYLVPDDKTLKKSIPVWTEHWHNNRTLMIINLFKQISIQQWIHFIIYFVCLLVLFIQLLNAFSVYLTFETIISAEYELPKTYRFPSISVCVPIIVPFGELCLEQNSSQKCDFVSNLFNASLSEFGHRCKFKHKNFINSCHSVAFPVESIYQNRKCFTYFSELSPKILIKDLEFNLDSVKETEINILIQSRIDHNLVERNAELLIHSSNLIPLSHNFEFISISANRKYEIRYHLTKINLIESKFNNECTNYLKEKKSKQSQNDCLDKCFHLKSNECGNNCLLFSRIIRKDLLVLGQKLCFNCSQEIENNLREKCRKECPKKDCIQDTYDYSLEELITGDLTESNVSLF